MSRSKKPTKRPPKDEPEWVKELHKKWTPEAIKAAQEEEARLVAKFSEEWFEWVRRYNPPEKPAEIIDLAAYRKNRSK